MGQASVQSHPCTGKKHPKIEIAITSAILIIQKRKKSGGGEGQKLFISKKETKSYEGDGRK